MKFRFFLALPSLRHAQVLLRLLCSDLQQCIRRYQPFFKPLLGNIFLLWFHSSDSKCKSATRTCRYNVKTICETEVLPMSCIHRGSLNQNANQTQGSVQPIFLSKHLIKWMTLSMLIQLHPPVSLSSRICAFLSVCRVTKSFKYNFSGL